MKKDLNKPLTNIPDPFEKYKSFGEHNNEMLKQFLNKFNFKFTFKSSPRNYKKGIFNNSLLRVLEKYEDIMNIILPTLREERRKTYCPFLPICPKTEKVLEIPLLSMDKKTGKVIFNNNDEKLETSILNGNCKLQWKVDWAMRWFTFDVDFEMYGKDLTEKAQFSQIKFAKFLEKIPRMDSLMNYFWMKKVRKSLSQKEMVFQLNSG